MKTSSIFRLSLLLTIGSLTLTFGQSRFAVSFSLAPTYSHTDSKIILPYTPSTGVTATNEIIINSHTTGYSFGFMGNYVFSTKWSVSTGIWASQSIMSKADVTTDGVNMKYSLPNKHPLNFAYMVPVLVNYQSSDKRLSPYFSAGATSNFRSTSYVDLGSGEIPIKVGKPIVVMPFLGIGAIYQLKDHLSFIVQPTIQYNLQDRPTYSYYHAYRLSLQAQLKYRF